MLNSCRKTLIAHEILAPLGKEHPTFLAKLGAHSDHALLRFLLRQGTIPMCETISLCRDTLVPWAGCTPPPCPSWVHSRFTCRRVHLNCFK